jgi:hypothetical protein
MIGSPSSVLTMGLGSWGSASLLVTLGYGTETAVVTLTDSRLEYTVGASRLGYTIRPGVVGYTVDRGLLGYEVKR